MKLHLVTIGKPKLAYAQTGWAEYTGRLAKLHSLRTSHLADKYAYDSGKLRITCGDGYKVALVIDGPQLSSHQLADFLNHQALDGREVCFIIGGPDGLPAEFIAACDRQLSFSPLTFPHDLAMVILTEALYRASAINNGSPYHH